MAHPKLPAVDRQRAFEVIRQRYQLAREIARLRDQQRELERAKRELPTNCEMARQLKVGSDLIRRIARGYEFVNHHPDDLNVQT